MPAPEPFEPMALPMLDPIAPPLGIPVGQGYAAQA
jgi:hypothetical protein